MLGIRIRSRIYVFGPPGSPPVLWLLYAFLSLKKDVNVASKSNKQKNFKYKFLVAIFKVTDENSRMGIRIRTHESEVWIPGSGSVPKCHRSATLVTKTSTALQILPGHDTGRLASHVVFAGTFPPLHSRLVAKARDRCTLICTLILNFSLFFWRRKGKIMLKGTYCPARWFRPKVGSFDRPFLKETSRRIYRMSLILTGSISLDSTFN